MSAWLGCGGATLPRACKASFAVSFSQTSFGQPTLLVGRTLGAKVLYPNISQLYYTDLYCIVCSCSFLDSYIGANNCGASPPNRRGDSFWGLNHFELVPVKGTHRLFVKMSEIDWE